MKIIAVTQRVTKDNDQDEWRDALDQRWTVFLRQCGAGIFPVPNRLDGLPALLKKIPLAGILLSGGGDLVSMKTAHAEPEREKQERLLIQYALENAVPVIGVCRGMEALCEYFRIPIKTVENHAGNNHQVTIVPKSTLSGYFQPLIMVNSYHNFAPYSADLNNAFSVMAYTGEIVEALEHRLYPFYGLMWHPERQSPFRAEELAFFKDVFKL